MIKVEINNRKKYPIAEKLILNIVRTAQKLNKKITGSIEINLVDNREIKKINKLWRRKDSVTDVLSFAWKEEKKLKSDCLGEIFISYPRIVQQAKEYKIPAIEEFSRMLIHGLLHLTGYNHDTKSGEKKMFSLQEKILLKQLKN